ncbi:MAG: hypothetical protein LKH52_04630 [Lactobacillus crispatus]|jgi:hypothetical protein|nr:hypothetical protein [Lactobacillus crispatus]
MAETENTQNFVPAWQIQAEKLEKVVADGNGAQVVYKSSNDDWCEPTLATKAYTTNDYPFVVEKPEGFVSPKYDWSHRKWVESANIAQGQDIEKMKSQIAELSKTTETVQTQQKNQNVESAQNSQLMMMVTKQLGIMNTKIDNLADKIAPVAPSTPTSETTPVAPTQPTTATQVTTPAPKEGGAQ